MKTKTITMVETPSSTAENLNLWSELESGDRDRASAAQNKLKDKYKPRNDWQEKAWKDGGFMDILTTPTWESTPEEVDTTEQLEDLEDDVAGSLLEDFEDDETFEELDAAERAEEAEVAEADKAAEEIMEKQIREHKIAQEQKKRDAEEARIKAEVDARKKEEEEVRARSEEADAMNAPIAGPTVEKEPEEDRGPEPEPEAEHKRKYQFL